MRFLTEAPPSVRKDKVKKYKICVKCLKKGSLHTVADCRAPKCGSCSGDHHFFLCDKEGGQQITFTTKEEEQDGNGGEEEDQEKKDGDAKQERMYQMEVQAAEGEY